MHFFVPAQDQCSSTVNGTVTIDGVETDNVDLAWATVFPNFNNLGMLPWHLRPVH